MRPVENKAMLITYADSLGGNLRGVQEILDEEFRGAFGGVHVLPFYPSSGDRGFAVVHYDSVEPRFGDWAALDGLAERYFVMADFMINHVSIRSMEFEDYLRRGDASEYRGMFIHWDEFWPDGGPSDRDRAVLYRRKPGGPVKEFVRDDGRVVRLWNTFFAEQVDIDPFTPATQEYYRRTLGRLAEHVPLIRFDAFAYAAKRPGTSCFFVEPEVWEVLEIGMEPLRGTGVQILPEIHEHHRYQLQMAERGHWVYDFALPMLMLHALMTGRTERLQHWLRICPRKQFTTLDTHDGIGVVDVVDLLDEDEIDLVVSRVEQVLADSRRFADVPTAIHRDGRPPRPYQLTSTFLSALGEDEDALLLARVVQLYTPGIPQLYYVGTLFGSNDVRALQKDRDPRSINRHDYDRTEVAARVTHGPVAQLLAILRFRNSFPAFQGELEVVPTPSPTGLELRWSTTASSTTLRANFASLSFEITAQENGDEPVVRFRDRGRRA